MRHLSSNIPSPIFFFFPRFFIQKKVEYCTSRPMDFLLTYNAINEWNRFGLQRSIQVPRRIHFLGIYLSAFPTPTRSYHCQRCLCSTGLLASCVCFQVWGGSSLSPQLGCPCVCVLKFKCFSRNSSWISL